LPFTATLPRGKNRPVISISGDGGFGQYLAEFTTAVKYGMDITHILLNNSELGKISKEQRAGNWKVSQTSLHNPSFADFANNCGGLGIRVEEPGQLEAALRKAIAHEGPALVEIIADPELI
jgi:thiamine pyrophosphate-dependent acetolactate synthase large subunit-like protein